MTEITPITREEFEALPPWRRGTAPAPEMAAVIALEVDEGTKFPCRWVHSHGCRATSGVHSMARNHGMRVTTRCCDGVVYVLRMA